MLGQFFGSFGHTHSNGVPDCKWIVFVPACTRCSSIIIVRTTARKHLFIFDLCCREDLPGRCDEEESGAAGAIINRSYQRRHFGIRYDRWKDEIIDQNFTLVLDVCCHREMQEMIGWCNNSAYGYSNISIRRWEVAIMQQYPLATIWNASCIATATERSSRREVRRGEKSIFIARYSLPSRHTPRRTSLSLSAPNTSFRPCYMRRCSPHCHRHTSTSSKTL